MTEDGSTKAGNIRGLTTDGRSVFFMPSNQASTDGIIREVGFDGEFIADREVSGAGSWFQASGLTELEQRDLTYSSGCIFIRENGLTNSKLYCIDTGSWIMSEVSVETEEPPGGSTPVGFLQGNIGTINGWLQGNLIDFPDGRIGAVSDSNWHGYSDDEVGTISMTTGTGAGECPASHYCKILRLYEVVRGESGVSLTFSEDIVLADVASDWPSDDHGIATDGTYLYQSSFGITGGVMTGGYKVWALQSDEPSYLVFNGDGSGACGATSGESGGKCDISGWSKSGLTMTNATYFARDHVGKRYLMGDFSNPRIVLTEAATDTPSGGPGNTLTTPSSPRAVSASAGDTQATVSWQEPADLGGADSISFYTVTASPGGATCTVSDTSCVITSLTNGTAYTFAVIASTNGGGSAAATSSAVTPRVPTTPSSGSTSESDDEEPPAPAAQPSSEPTRFVAPTDPTASTPPTNQLLSGPVRTPASQNGGVGTRTTIDGVPRPTRTMEQNGGVAVQSGTVSLALRPTDPNGGGAVQRNSQSNEPELSLPTGQSTRVAGDGLLPGSSVQVWLPNVTTRELARVPVNGSGEFDGEVSLAHGPGEGPLPIGPQVMQVTALDESGAQTVVEMTINIAQGSPSPEANRETQALPDLDPSQTLGTSAGLPTNIVVTPLPEQRAVTVEGSDWSFRVLLDGDALVAGQIGAPSIEVKQSTEVTLTGEGFMRDTAVTAWLFSDPTLLGTVSVMDDGTLSLDFIIDPAFIAPGEHTLQLQGVGADGYIKAANLGVLVEQPVELTTESTSGLLGWVAGGLLLLLVVLFVIVARRRRAQTR